jgi:hypothetical protein
MKTKILRSLNCQLVKLPFCVGHTIRSSKSYKGSMQAVSWHLPKTAAWVISIEAWTFRINVRANFVVARTGVRLAMPLTGFDRDPIRKGRYGYQSWERHKQAEHLTASSSDAGFWPISESRVLDLG